VFILKKIISKILSYVLVAVIASGTTVACFFFAQKNNSTKLKEVENIISQYFIGDVDMGKLEDAAASAMVSALGDRWSYYMTAEQYQSYQQTMSNSYVGIGITILVRQDGTGFDITEVVDGGPAQQAGVLAGDILTAVDGTNVAGMDTASLSPLVRGEENTNVKLTILRNGETKEFTITRKKFQTPVATYQMLPDNIGLITIENFDQRCADETIAAIEALTAQGAEALIFDVRNNPGGFKTEMLKVLDYLLPEGPLFRAVDYRGKETVDYSDAKHLEIPMAVVMNLSSYSAAEFFAAALDEYDAAVTVGEKTFGKGHFQNAIPLSDGSAINLSVGKYTTPKGVSLTGVGLQPEVEVTVDETTAAKILAGTLAPEEDPQILAAINALKS
jgi:carboxyl-terminal processing protease